MPLTKLDPTSEEFSFLKPLVDGREKIVEEHNKMKHADYTNHFALTNWNLMLLQRGPDKVENMKNFPTISNFSENFPDKYLLSYIAISEIGYGDTGYHYEMWTKADGYYRIHFPLANIDGCSIDIIEEDDQIVNYRYELGSVYNFENPFNMHKPSNFNEDGSLRLMILMDFVEKGVNPDMTDEELLRRYLIGNEEFTAMRMPCEGRAIDLALDENSDYKIANRNN